MSTKQTPGPWIARCMDTYGGTDWTKNGGRIRGRNSEGQEVAIAHIYSNPQAEANAALIAAAPETAAERDTLRDACTAALKYMVSHIEQFGWLEEQVADTLRAALARTTI